MIQAIILLFGTSAPAASNWTGGHTLQVAVFAHSGIQHAVQQWGPTIDYLNASLPHYRFVLRPYTSLEQQLADAGTRKYHFLLTNPAAYVQLQDRHGARALLTLVNDRNGTAQPRFGSVIFTHIDDSDILSLRDLKGKDFIAVHPLGFGGWRAGLKVLRDHGLNPRSDFHSLRFAGAQPAVVHAVLQKKVHAGMVRTDMLERLARNGDISLRNIRVLNPQSTPDFPFFHSSPLYPEWPFAAMAGTSPALGEEVKQVLLKLTTPHAAARAGQYVGWIPALDYQPVRELLIDIGTPALTDPGATTRLPLWLILSGLLLMLLVMAVLRRQTGR